MKTLSLFIIKSYWYFIPVHKRNKCLFKESCSVYVFKTIKRSGLKLGLQALWFRYRNCRSNYIITHTGEQTLLVTATNHVLQENEIRESLIINN